jgi:hypothetical protein
MVTWREIYFWRERGIQGFYAPRTGDLRSPLRAELVHCLWQAVLGIAQDHPLVGICFLKS